MSDAIYTCIKFTDLFFVVVLIKHLLLISNGREWIKVGF